jgi:hypothetical protein
LHFEYFPQSPLEVQVVEVQTWPLHFIFVGQSVVVLHVLVHIEYPIPVPTQLHDAPNNAWHCALSVQVVEVHLPLSQKQFPY